MLWRIMVAGMLLAGWAFAAAPVYQVDDGFKVKLNGRVRRLAISPDGNVCALVDERGRCSISVVSPSGKVVGGFEADGQSAVGSFTVGNGGQLYLFSSISVQKEYTWHGRKFKRDVPENLMCSVFNMQGKPLRSFVIPKLRSAVCAHVLSDGALALADAPQKTIFIVDPESGAEKSRIKKGIRLCCGIFDFCVEPGDTILVANLGAFRVQRFDRTGKLLWNFGKRGRELADFRGCCNPVSVCRLPGGAVVTAEKSPTRIKVYDKDGKTAELIKGVQELVEDCSYIPMVADKQGRLYLAAPRKGLVLRCVPVGAGANL